MANTLFPRVADGQTYSQETHSILDEMICKGNRVAEARKAELTHLESLFRELAEREQRRGLQTLTLFSPENAHTMPENNLSEEQQAVASGADSEMNAPSMARDPPSSPGINLQTSSNVEFLDNIGISSYEFLSIVDQIGNSENLSYSILDPGHDWEEAI